MLSRFVPFLLLGIWREGGGGYYLGPGLTMLMDEVGATV